MEWSLKIQDRSSRLGSVMEQGDLFSINSWDGSTYRNIFSLNNVGNGVISGSLKIGAYTLPAADGTNNQVLTTNGAGIASWPPQLAQDYWRCSWACFLHARSSC